uniref:Uncharacterized protein n=1 Tax=Anguilla anguilla TaxID=7936 RepID=A0A0E9SUF7_ANGAN
MILNFYRPLQIKSVTIKHYQMFIISDVFYAKEILTLFSRSTIIICI